MPATPVPAPASEKVKKRPTSGVHPIPKIKPEPLAADLFDQVFSKKSKKVGVLKFTYCGGAKLYEGRTS